MEYISLRISLIKEAKKSNIQKNLQHLFFKCIITNRFISNITILINTLNVGTVNLNENNMMFGFNMGGKHELLLNKLILYLSGLFGRQETELNMTKFISIRMYFVIYGNRL